MDGIEAEFDPGWDELLHDSQLRLAALDLVSRRLGDRVPVASSLLEEAEIVFRWATKRTPATIRIVTIGDITEQDPQEDAPMQIRDSQRFPLSIEVDDAKGFEIVDDQVTVTSSDETVVTVVDQGSGTYLIVAGNPGSAVVTFNAGTDNSGNPVIVTEAVDVVTGTAATVKLTEGAVEEQPPAV